GQVTCHTGYGQNRKCGLWNPYQRQPIRLKAGDPNSNWTYSSSTVRAANGAPSAWSATVFNVGSGTASNGATMFQGLAEEYYDVRVVGRFLHSVAGATGQVGIGVNSVTAYSGTVGNMTEYPTVASNNTFGGFYNAPPALGLTTLAALEAVTSNNA